MYSAKTNRPLPALIPKSGIFVLESHHGSDFRMQTTAHPFFKIMYVLDGAGAVTCRKSSARIGRSDVIVVPAGFAHRIEDDPRDALSLIVLCVQQNVLRIAEADSAEFPSCRVLRNNATSIEVRRVLRQLFFEQSLSQPQSNTMMTGLTLQLLASVGRACKPHGVAVEAFNEQSAPETRVRAYAAELKRKLCESEKIDNIAQRLGISRRYFTRLFRKVTGRSWLPYARELRLQHARSLLRNTDRSVLLIAFESGFDDLSSFYRAFKAAEGISPVKWRESQVK
jgi:AraC-like DNA-binding protein